MRKSKGKTPVVAATEVLGINTQRKKDIYMSNIVTKAANIVEFHGDSLETLLINDEPYVALKPICEGIGLDWRGQINRIKRDEVLNSVVVVTATTGADGKRYQMWTLPLKMLNGWLFGISANRVKPGLKAKLTEYRRECFDVLADYWQKGYAINPRPFSVGRDDVLTVAEADELRDLMKGWAAKLSSDTRVQGQFLQQGWSKLKAHFKVPYRQIPRFELPEALSIIMRHVNEWESKTSVVQAQQPYDANSLTGPDLAITHAVQTLIERARYLVGFWHQYGPAIRMLNSDLANGIYDCFWDADWSSGLLAKKLGIPIKSREYFQNYPFDKDSLDRGREYEVVSVRVL